MVLVVVLPGEGVSGSASGGSSIRGHGSYTSSGRLRASVAGCVERVDKVVTVRGVGGRYVGEVGDLVVGVVREVGHKSWKVDIGATRLATLTLSGVHLPNDAQRIRTRQDALAMRELFDVDDVLVAEVRAVKGDGTTHLQTRANRYGRLANGALVKVRASLVRRLPAHFATVKNVDVALGNNGFVWLQRRIPQAWIDDVATSGGGGSGEIDAKLSADAWKGLRDKHADTPLTHADARSLRRAANAVTVLGHHGASVTPATIAHLYDLSLSSNYQKNNDNNLLPLDKKKEIFNDDPDDLLIPHHGRALIRRMFDSDDAWHLGRNLMLDAMIDQGATKRHRPFGDNDDGLLHDDDDDNMDDDED
mmetsp:Transcript_5965/g.19383  ORF Transcript_5965/g.19383 Transcript_5965/m.19383 type:complete len:362 (+) Transcript_5965:165-1250(+)